MENFWKWWMILSIGYQLIFTIIGLIFVGGIGQFIIDLIKALKNKL